MDLVTVCRMPTKNVYQNPLNVSIKIHSNCLRQPESCSQKILIEDTQFAAKTRRIAVPGHSIGLRQSCERNLIPKLGKRKANNSYMYIQNVKIFHLGRSGKFPPGY